MRQSMREYMQGEKTTFAERQKMRQEHQEAGAPLRADLRKAATELRSALSDEQKRIFDANTPGLPPM